MDKYIGQMLDERYELMEVIGVGGMAVVYKALCHRLNRLVAVKILKDEYQKDEEFRRRFQAESQAIAMLSHANIVAVYDISSGGDLDYIVMELIDGMTLKEYVQQRGEISWREALHFSAQIAKALDHAHSRGVVHRDIKPHNIMVLKDGSVKVADFGIAQLAFSRNTLTREALGSVHYISPEQARGSGTDQRTDLYSLGVVMYELLTGQLPYDGETPVSVAIQHINGGAKRPRELKASIPLGLEQIVMKAMQPNPDERYQTAGELADDLEAFRKDPTWTLDSAVTGREATAHQVQAAIERQKRAAQAAGEKTAQKKPAQSPTPAAGHAGRRPGRTDRHSAQGKDKGPSFLAIGIATLCVVLVLSGIGYFLYQYVLRDLFTSSKEISVPSLLGQSIYEIQLADYPDLDLVIGPRVYDDSTEGTVISQSPESGRTVKEGNNTVTLTVSLGAHTEILPDLTGDTQEDATVLLQGLDLNLAVDTSGEYTQELAEGRVIRTEPAAQTTLQEGDTVTLVVSMGQEIHMIQVPDLVGGYTLEQAQTRAEEAGLSFSHAVEVESDQAAGIVTDQSLAAGSSVREGTRITLYVSDGSKDQNQSLAAEPEETQPLTQPETLEAQPETEPEPEADESAEPETPVVPETTEETQPDTEPEAGLVAEITSEPTEAQGVPQATQEPEQSPFVDASGGLAQELDPPKVTTNVTIELPAGDDVIVVTLKLDGEQVGRYAADSGDGSLTVQISGRGVQRLDVYFDGILTQTQTIDFDQAAG